MVDRCGDVVCFRLHDAYLCQKLILSKMTFNLLLRILIEDVLRVAVLFIIRTSVLQW